jgi:hypothetical protein
MRKLEECMEWGSYSTALHKHGRKELEAVRPFVVLGRKYVHYLALCSRSSRLVNSILLFKIVKKSRTMVENKVLP